MRLDELRSANGVNNGVVTSHPDAGIDEATGSEEPANHG